VHCSSLLYAMRVLRGHGISTMLLQDVFRATVIAKITYCLPAWSGLCSASDRAKLDSFLNHCKRLGFCDPPYQTFLANVNSRSRSLYAIACPSVVCLSVTLVRPTQAVQILRNISTALDTLAIHRHPLKFLRRSSQGNPSAGGVKHKRGSQI